MRQFTGEGKVIRSFASEERRKNAEKACCGSLAGADSSKDYLTFELSLFLSSATCGHVTSDSTTPFSFSAAAGKETKRSEERISC